MKRIDSTSWHVLVPVRGGTESKSRLTGAGVSPSLRRELARAFASDVVVASLTSPRVREVTVVTRDTDTARHFSELGARIFAEPEGAGLNGAIRAAANWVSESFPNDNLVVVMGDLAGVTSETLTAALSAAEQVDRGVIADQEGTGTTVLTAKSGVSLQPAYGSGSFTRHVAAGHSPIPTPAESPLRRDVDTGDDLATLARLGPGEHTRALLARIDAFPPHTSPT